MSKARFWYIPLKDIAPAKQQSQFVARDDVRAGHLPVWFNVRSVPHQEGIRVGHVSALHDGDTVTALAPVLALDSAGSLHWSRLQMLDALQLSATPELREVMGTDAQQFKLDIDAVLRDEPVSSGATTSPAATMPASGARYWKASLGRNGIARPEWRQRGIAAIRWPDLGDISTRSEAEFQVLAKAKYDKHNPNEGPYRVWLFRGIQPGDRIIANNGRTSIPGVGTVTEGYRYHPGEHAVETEDLPHQIKVNWDATAERDVEGQADWTRTLRELPQEKFEALVGGSDAAPLSVIVREGLDRASAVPVEATS